MTRGSARKERSTEPRRPEFEKGKKEERDDKTKEVLRLERQRLDGLGLWVTGGG